MYERRVQRVEVNLIFVLLFVVSFVIINARKFYNASSQRIRRADPIQVYLDMCDCCRSRRGFDFILAVPVRVRRSECRVLQ